tara:strand:- start:823 stop:1242 length:420 start_codon:yes stop_codon:yes gene_type:complete
MKNENFNAYTALMFIDLIVESNNFYEQLVDKFSDLSTLAEKLHNNPTDQNKDLMFSVYEKNEKTFTEFTHAYIKNNSTEFDWDLFVSRYEVTFVGGKFFEIEKTEQAYADLIEQMHQEKWVFNHMSVTSDANKYVVFFA